MCTYIWLLGASTPIRTLPLDARHRGTLVPQTSCAHPTSKPWLRHCSAHKDVGIKRLLRTRTVWCPIHTADADATKLFCRVASASAVCIGYYSVFDGNRRRVRSGLRRFWYLSVPKSMLTAPFQLPNDFQSYWRRKKAGEEGEREREEGPGTAMGNGRGRSWNRAADWLRPALLMTSSHINTIVSDTSVC